MVYRFLSSQITYVPGSSLILISLYFLINCLETAGIAASFTFQDPGFKNNNSSNLNMQ